MDAVYYDDVILQDVTPCFDPLLLTLLAQHIKPVEVDGGERESLRL